MVKSLVKMVQRLSLYLNLHRFVENNELQHEIVLPEMVSPGGSTRGSRRTTAGTNNTDGDALTDEGTTDSTNPSTGTDEPKEPSSHATYSNSPGANELIRSMK